ncbi:MAG: isochorismate synthase, partial [Micrococcales bacterium]
MVGYGTALQLGMPGGIDGLAQEWADLSGRAVVRDEVKLPGTGCIGFVSAPFSASSKAGAVIVVPRTVVGRRKGRWWVTRIGVRELPYLREVEPQLGPPAGPGEVLFTQGALSEQQWREQVAEAVRRVAGGQLEKVVLARDIEATCDRPVDPRWLLQRLARRYDGCATFWVDSLVGATPEFLVRSERGLVTSRVLAGTVGRTGNDVQDLAHAASLAHSSKDLEEHKYAVRSVADALAPFCASMNVPETPFVLHLPKRAARQPAGMRGRPAPTSVLDLARALHPSAAVCGTPTRTAAGVIAELEGMDRDRYAGPVGWVDAAGDGELGIALRCARVNPEDPRRLRLFAGCGIVAGSDPAKELAESQAKLVPMQHALSGAPD